MISRSAIAWSLAALSGVTTLTCGYLMAGRIAAFHQDNPREVFAFQRVDYTDFEFAGRKVHFTNEDQNGVPYLRVQYGQDEERLLATLPGDMHLPGLIPHEQWLRVLMFASAIGKTIDQVHADLRGGKIAPRMVIVTRTPPPGEPAAYEGRLNPTSWFFDFYELRPEGGFAHERLRFPTTKVHQPDKQGELRENTWQYQAALSVIPEGIAPKPKFSNDGLKAAGWTLPATTGSSMVMLAAIAAACITARPRMKTAPVA